MGPRAFRFLLPMGKGRWVARWWAPFPGGLASKPRIGAEQDRALRDWASWVAVARGSPAGALWLPGRGWEWGTKRREPAKPERPTDGGVRGRGARLPAQEAQRRRRHPVVVTGGRFPVPRTRSHPHGRRKKCPACGLREIRVPGLAEIHPGRLLRWRPAWAAEPGKTKRRWRWPRPQPLARRTPLLRLLRGSVTVGTEWSMHVP